MPGLTEHLVGRSLFDQFARVQDGDAVGQAGSVQIVGDEDEGEVVAVSQQTGQHVEDAAPGDRVDAGGDLVADQDPGVGEQGAGEGGALEFAAGEPGGGNACVDDTVAAYLIDGMIPVRDVRCAGPGLPEPSGR